MKDNNDIKKSIAEMFGVDESQVRMVAIEKPEQPEEKEEKDVLADFISFMKSTEVKNPIGKITDYVNEIIDYVNKIIDSDLNSQVMLALTVLSNAVEAILNVPTPETIDSYEVINLYFEALRDTSDMNIKFNITI